MSKVKEQLSTLLKKGQLKAHEREAFEGMWDAVHRYGKLSPKQRAWIERVYYGQNLDRSNASKPQGPKRTQSGTQYIGAVQPPKTARIGYINHSGTRETLMVTNMTMLRELCPGIKPGSKQYQKIEAFFRNGGEVLKIKPVERKESA